MPQKRNPISCVYITAQTGVVRSQVVALLNAMEQDHERATGQWEIEWIVLPEIFVLTAGCLAQTQASWWPACRSTRSACAPTSTSPRA